MRAQPLLYSLFTHDCVAMHASNSTIKFVDDTTVIGLITNNDEPWRSGAREITSPSKSTKHQQSGHTMTELIVDIRRQQREHASIHIDGAAVEKVKSFKFLSVHITDNMK